MNLQNGQRALPMPRGSKVKGGCLSHVRYLTLEGPSSHDIMTAGPRFRVWPPSGRRHPGVRTAWGLCPYGMDVNASVGMSIRTRQEEQLKNSLTGYETTSNAYEVGRARHAPVKIRAKVKRYLELGCQVCGGACPRFLSDRVTK